MNLTPKEILALIRSMATDVADDLNPNSRRANEGFGNAKHGIVSAIERMLELAKNLP